MLVGCRCVNSDKSRDRSRKIIPLRLSFREPSKTIATINKGWKSFCFIAWVTSLISWTIIACGQIFPLIRLPCRSCINFCQNGEVTSQDLSEQTEEVQRAWYRMLEEDLPDEIAEHELEEVEETRNRELLRKESQQIGKESQRSLSQWRCRSGLYWNSSA